MNRVDLFNVTATRGAKSRSGTTLRARIYQYRFIYLMLFPGILFLLVMNYLPMFGALIAFKQIDYALGILKSPWV